MGARLTPPKGHTGYTAYEQYSYRGKVNVRYIHGGIDYEVIGEYSITKPSESNGV